MKKLAVLTRGKKYTGWIGFVDDEPHVMTIAFADDHVQLFPSKRAALRCYEDVRRVTIIIDQQKQGGKE